MVDAEWAAGVPGMPNRLDGRNRLALIYWQLRRKQGSRWSLVAYLISQRYKYEEIAEILNIPVGTVRSIIHRIRTFLHQNHNIMAENEENNSVNRVPSELTEVIPGETKRCHGKCGLIKPAGRFSKHSGKKDGLQDICKDCTSDFMRDYNARKNFERKAQLTAGDLNLSGPPKPVPLTPAGKMVKKEVVKQLPKAEKVKLPDAKPAKQPEKPIIGDKQVKLLRVSSLTDEDLDLIGKILTRHRDEIMRKIDNQIATIDKVIEKISR